MELKTADIIGLMSGTSLDGIDLVYVKFDRSSYKDFKILNATTIPYSAVWKDTLQNAISLSDEKLAVLDQEYGFLLAETINNFIAENELKEIDFIASHGHTVFHKPALGITLQIGNGQVIATETNQKVVCDFRTQDVDLGGQGAPLVPMGDKFLFKSYDSCLNLGGFANISFKENDERIAFDICPVNIVLNYYVNALGLPYDDKGKMAAEGIINHELLSELNALDFYKMNNPKSLGLEWVQSEIFPLIAKYDLDIPSILRTFVAHIAVQIASCLVGKKEVLITGGGVYNRFLISSIQQLSDAKIIVPNAHIIDFKEALIFAFLGLLRIDNQVNCLSSVTGAKNDHSSGQLFYP